jgi:cytochrome c oxidase assembly factor CtaG
MKDLLTITIVGILLWWVMIWPDNAWSEVVFEDNKAMVWVKVFSF